MGITKTDGFSKEIIQKAEILKIIGHPARLAIIQYLAQVKSCICNDIVNEIPLSQPTISRHLSEMKKVGLIKGTVEGKNICYCLNPTVWNELTSFLGLLGDKINCHNNDCC